MHEVTFHYDHTLCDSDRRYLDGARGSLASSLVSFSDTDSGTTLTFIIGQAKDRTDAVRRALQQATGIWPHLHAHGVDVSERANAS